MLYATLMQDWQQLNLNPAQLRSDLIFIIFPLRAACLPVIKMFHSSEKPQERTISSWGDVSHGIFQMGNQKVKR